MRVFVLGIWGSRVGGANGECLGAVQLWRRNGLDVTMIPTWGKAEPESRKIADELGCQIVEVEPRQFRDVPGLPGCPVVNFCNENAYLVKRQLKELGCRLIAAPCMCYPGSGLRAAVQTGHVHSLVFQSKYQRSRMERRLHGFGEVGGGTHLVRGYLDWEAIKFQPRYRDGEPFTIGRIARDSTNKWLKEWWQMYECVPDRKAVLLGYGIQATRQCGRPPEWATVHRPGSVPASSIYPQLHAYVTCNGGDEENWPRTGLEAMAYGVPIVAEARFGWQEMVLHGETGGLGKTWQEIGDHAAALAENDDLRLELASAARERLKTICDPVEIWEGWKKVLDG